MMYLNGKIRIRDIEHIKIKQNSKESLQFTKSDCVLFINGLPVKWMIQENRYQQFRKSESVGPLMYRYPDFALYPRSDIFKTLNP